MLKRILRNLALLYLVAATLLASFLSVVEDHLLFYSDLPNLAVFLVAVALLLWLPLAAAYCFVVLVAPTGSARLDAPIARFAIGLVLTAFLLCLVDHIGLLPQSLGWLAIIWFAVALVFALLLRWLPGRDGVVRRVSWLASAVAVGTLIVLGGGVSYAKLAVASSYRHTEPKHVIMLVLDGLTKTYLHTYNAQAAPGILDVLLRDGLVLERMYSNTIWTHGFHGVLYSGGYDLAYYHQRPDTPMQPDRPTLLSILQENGVRTRWMTFHKNGVPESNWLCNYRGLRSVFLSEHLSWLPAALGLDYNVYTHSYSARESKMAQRERTVYRMLNGCFSPLRMLPDYVLQEAERLHQDADRSFLYVHVPDRLDLASYQTTHPRWKEIERLHEKWHKSGKTYAPEEEWAVEIARQECRRNAQYAGIVIQQLLEGLSRRGLSEHTMVLVTADHGMALSNGRIGKVYNYEEETCTVPFLALNAGLKGRDDRLFGTIDISRSLFDYFDIDATLSDRSVSMFGDEEKPFVVVNCRRNAKLREWNQVIYKADKKYVYNHDPDGDWCCRVARVEGLSAPFFDQGDHLLAEISEELSKMLAWYHIGEIRGQPGPAPVIPEDSLPNAP